MSTFVPKVLKFFNSIDPFKEFAQLPQPRRLIALHAQLLCISLIGFFAYVGFSIRVYASAPEVFEQTSTSILSSTEALFKLSIAVPIVEHQCNPKYPQTTYLPHDNHLTQVSSPFIVDNHHFFYYNAYLFPVYGTVDSVSQSSNILVFFPCQLLSFPEEYRDLPLIVSLHNDLCSVLSEPLCKIFGDLNASASHAYLYLNLSQGGSPVAVDLILQKTVSSAGVATYNVSFAGTPSYTPLTTLYTNKQLTQQSIVVNIQSSVAVTTYSPKSILSLLGSCSGMFSAFMAISGVVSSMIWSRFGVKQDGRSMVGSDAVAAGSASLEPI
jgi:hypothetical protein